MKIAQINQSNYQPLKTKNQMNKTSFNGFHVDGKALFIGDLDGTIAHRTRENLRTFLNLIKKHQTYLTFSTGRNIEKFKELQTQLNAQGVNLPNPRYLITQNGAHVYKQHKGIFMEDKEWADTLKHSFNRPKILESIRDLAFQPEYLFPGAKPKNGMDFSASKLCPFEFWPTPHRLQFIVDGSVSESILRTLKDKLASEGISARVIKQFFTKDECHKFFSPEDNALFDKRYAGKDYITQIDIAASNKGDGAEFVQKKLNIPDEETVLAGDDANDISMARLALSGKNFIGVGNRKQPLDKYMKYLIEKNPNLSGKLFFPKEEGLGGIVEGINQLITL